MRAAPLRRRATGMTGAAAAATNARSDPERMIVIAQARARICGGESYRRWRGTSVAGWSSPPGSSRWSSRRRSRSRAGRRTRPTWSRSRSGTRASPASARRGHDPFALEEVVQRLPEEQFAARAAIDAALHDLCGKLVGEPVWRLLGLERDGPPTSWTIGLDEPDAMARKAERAEASGRFKRLKLKLGGRDGLDVDRVRAVRGVTRVPLQVDVNEYWSLDEALDALPQLAELGVEYCEQPLRHGDEG